MSASTTTVHRQESNLALTCHDCPDLIDGNLFTLEFEKFENGDSEFRRYHRECWTAKTGQPC
jgi:hypothetical protein